jgi:hypothetical protein
VSAPEVDVPVRRRLVAPAVSVLTLAVLGAAQVPANAQAGNVHLVVTTNGTIITDALQIAHSVTVTNLGPDTATGIFTTQYALYCSSDSAPLSSCTGNQPTLVRMRDLPPGGAVRNTYLAPIPVAGTRPHVVRSTIEVVHVDQHDVASVPGTCNYGLNPQPDCVTVLTYLVE